MATLNPRNLVAALFTNPPALRSVVVAGLAVLVTTFGGCLGAGKLAQLQSAAQSVQRHAVQSAAEARIEAEVARAVGDAEAVQLAEAKAEQWETIASQGQVAGQLAGQLAGDGSPEQQLTGAASTTLQVVGGAVGGAAGLALLLGGRALPAVVGAVRRGAKFNDLAQVTGDLIESFQRAKDADPDAAASLFQHVKQQPRTEAVVSAVQGRAEMPRGLEPLAKVVSRVHS